MKLTFLQIFKRFFIYTLIGAFFINLAYVWVDFFNTKKFVGTPYARGGDPLIDGIQSYFLFSVLSLVVSLIGSFILLNIQKSFLARRILFYICLIIFIPTTLFLVSSIQSLLGNPCGGELACLGAVFGFIFGAPGFLFALGASVILLETFIFGRGKN